MIPEQHTGRQSNRLDPETSWALVTEAPLKGLGLAREAGSILAWDETDQLYLIDLRGSYRSVTRAPGKVVAAVVSDDGSRIALLGEGSRVWLLDGDLNVVSDRLGPPEPLALAIDPHGRYVVVTSKMGFGQFYNRHGKPAGKFETNQPLAHVVFVPDRPILLGAAAYGLLLALDLTGAGGGKLDAEADWVDRQVTGVGRLTTTGDGSVVLASCFTHGVQRYDVLGHNAGSYHLGGTAVHAVPDFAGRMIAVATLEGELSLLNSGGNVRWKTGLPRPVLALEADPLGRFLVYGHATGEVVRLDLYGSDHAKTAEARATPREGSTARPAPLAVRAPDWSIPVAASDAQAESLVLGVLDDPPRIGVFASNLKMQLFTSDGQNLGYAPEIIGVGRILRTSPGWIAAATDRQIVLFQAARGTGQRVDLSLVEVTHLAVRPETFGLAVVQERDRVGRATVAGRWIWKHELKTAIEDIAIGPDGHCAFTTDGGRLSVLDAAGQTIGGYQTDPPEALSLIAAVDGAPAGVVWTTLARRAQVLRGHDLPGRVVWEAPVAFEGWQFLRLDSIAVVSAPDGRAQAFDGSGHLRDQGKSSSGGARDHFTANPRGEVLRISVQGVHLICSDLDARVRWRAVSDEPIGPISAGQNGVAAMIGRSLAWFHGLD